MKHYWKILIMVLLLCLVMTGMAVSAYADFDLITAIANADDGGTVTLTENCTVTEPITIDKSLTLDLNGKTITVPNGFFNEDNMVAFNLATYEKIEVTVKNGTIEAEYKGIDDEHNYNRYLFYDDLEYCDYDENGEILIDWSTFRLKDCKIHVQGFVTAVGNYDGESVPTVEIVDSEISAENEHEAEGDYCVALHIYNGEISDSTISAKGIYSTAIETSGDLSFYNATISSDGISSTAICYSGNSIIEGDATITATGADSTAIYLNGYSGPWDLVIRKDAGGVAPVITGAYAVRFDDEYDASGANTSISDGLFDGKINTKYTVRAGFITGGYFTEKPGDALLGKDADGNQLFAIKNPAYPNGSDGTQAYEFMVGAVAQIASVTVGSGQPEIYSSLADAIAAANTQTGSSEVTVKLLGNDTLSSAVEITRALTLDLNGWNVDVSSELTNGAIEVKADVTFTDSSASASGVIGKTSDRSTNTVYTVFKVSAGTLTVAGGRITSNHLGTADVYSQTILAAGGNVSVIGGRVDASGHYTSAIQNTGSGTVTVNGGRVDLSMHANSASVHVSPIASAAIVMAGTTGQKLVIEESPVISGTKYSLDIKTALTEGSSVSGGRYQGAINVASNGAGGYVSTQFLSGGIYDERAKESIQASWLAEGRAIGDNSDEQTKNTYPFMMIAHAHEWSYAAGTGENANTITATCANTDGGHGTPLTATLTIAAPTLTIVGEAGKSEYATLEGLEEFNAATGLAVEDTDVTYYEARKSDNAYTKGKELSAAPTGAGVYLAEITLVGVGDAQSVSASVVYIIQPVKVSRPDFIVPSGVQIIGENAFEGASMESALIPDGCTAIGAGAFKNCAKLEQISIPGNCTIGEGAFKDCGTVFIFAPTGSAAASYCSDSTNCVFIAED